MALTAKVQDLKQGEYVKRRLDSPVVYIRKGYDRSTKRYTLQDTSDSSKEFYVKRDTVLHHGFTY